MAPEKEPSVSKSSVLAKINLVESSFSFVSLEGAIELVKKFRMISNSCLL